MKYHKKRRFGALVLALAMALSLVAPVWAGPSGNLTISGSAELEKGKSIELTATWVQNTQPQGVTVDYSWSVSGSPQGVSLTNKNAAVVTVQADDTAAVGNVTVELTATWTENGNSKNDSASYTLNIKEPTTANIPVTSVTLPATLELKEKETQQLTATILPADATNKKVTWTSSDAAKATVDAQGNVTGVSVGEATITVTTEDGNKTATCEVTVTDADSSTSPSPPPSESPAPGNSANTVIFGESPIVWDVSQPNPWTLTVAAGPAGAVMQPGDTIKWSVSNKDTTVDKKLLPDLKPGEDSRTVSITNKYPGEYIFSATYYVKADNTESQPVFKDVTISGITLNEREHEMTLDQTFALAVDKSYGMATGGTVRDIVWTSSDPSVVTVLNGDLVAWKTGSVVITANKNGYTAECKVTVTEDTAAIAGPYYATTGNPLVFKNVYSGLNQISINKTKDTNTSGSPLRYITNVTVPTGQGTMYYNYNSEANTGEGVGMADTFRDASVSDSTVARTLDRLYFVPRQGFTGTAEITFTGRAQNGTVFSGIVRVNVTGQNNISYRTNAGEAVNFLSGDFNAFCRAKLGRDVNYVTFNLPQESQGTLYYNYTAPGQHGDRVTTSTQYSRSGRYLIDEVSFVPNAAFTGDAAISFRGVDTAGNSFTGEVVVSVIPSSSSDVSDVYISGERGKPVALQSNLFNDACRATLRDTLSYVIFKLPDYSDGTLYYNYRGENDYDSRVTAATRYFYSGVPGINGISFVPASNNTGRIAIPYTGYGAGGTTFTGTLYITIGETERSTVRYFVAKNGVVNFNVNDFNSVCLLKLGVSLDYVRFQLPAIDSRVGTLYYNYRSSNSYSRVYSGFSYYRSPKASNWGRIDLISFHAGASAGTITIPYTGYAVSSGSGGAVETYQGTLVIQVGSPTPAEINLACKTAGQAWLSAYSIYNACRQVMSGSLSYIEITSLPSAKQGRMYYNYSGFGTGTEVKPGDRFYYLGEPNINQVCFVPHSGFTGQAEITYIGVSSSGNEQLSGRILVNVSQTTQSQYFNDMSRYVWAIDSVDYLYQNRAVEGVGGGRYSPQGRITKGDFTLMLVRAFGFTASGSVSYKDVPANSYYAEAIRIAGLLGIGSSSNGCYYPNIALSRQDAMVMIRNALVAGGWDLNNGLAADLDKYHDKDLIAPYARTAVGSLVQMGIVQGDGNGCLRPTALLNRAETAKLLHTLMTL